MTDFSIRFYLEDLAYTYRCRLERFGFLFRAFLKGALHTCDKCRKLDECRPYGVSLQEHYDDLRRNYPDHLKKYYPEFNPPSIDTKYADWRVCPKCYGKIGSLTGAHRKCCDLTIKIYLTGLIQAPVTK